MSVIANLFGYLLNFLYNIFNNYGWAIIVFSVILKIILIPITISQQKNMKKSAKVQEKMSELQKKYKNNPEKLNQETMELYKKEKMNPLSGCLASILQIIIILSVFWLVSKPLTYMKKVDSEVINNYTAEIKEEDGSAVSYPEIQIIQKKGAEDETVYLNMNFLGLDLSKTPSQNMSDFTVYIIPALYVITSFVSIKITNNMQNKKKKSKEIIVEQKSEENTEEDGGAVDAQEDAMESMQQMSNSMSYMVPIMSISIAFFAPLGLALYWLVSNVLIIVERLVIKKIFNKEENADA